MKDMSTRTFILCNAILALLALVVFAAGIFAPRHQSAGNTERPSATGGEQPFTNASSGDSAVGTYRAYRHEAESADGRTPADAPPKQAPGTHAD